MKVCIGGTFNILHKGHKTLINKSFEVAGVDGTVFIGLASGKLVKSKIGIKSLYKRKTELEKYLKKKKFLKKATIQQITDKYGPTLIQDFDAIVVSPETLKTAEEINIKRKEKGKKPMKIIQIPYVLAEDGKPISSSRIINKEIYENGNILQRD